MDKDAFQILMQKYARKIYNTCYRLVGGYEAEDISQEVFLKIYKNIDKFKGSSDISTWIYKITVNTCREYWRKNKAYDKRVELKENIIMNDSNVDKGIINDELKKYIGKALVSMDMDKREALILRDINGLSYDEISKILGVPVGTVKSRIARGREYIKKFLEDRELL
ncbi:MAG: RNA polymerase sigma factor [Thermoanaerobacteraceae bacterium]|nr:RNA polymerase sigma factor [Thermoanaerobacteraceae bacterium]